MKSENLAKVKEGRAVMSFISSTLVLGIMAWGFFSGLFTRHQDSLATQKLAKENYEMVVLADKKVDDLGKEITEKVNHLNDRVEDNELQQLIQNEQTKNVLYELLRVNDPENAETRIKNMETVNAAVKKKMEEQHKHKKENSQ